jgi:hypothetical protein
MRGAAAALVIALLVGAGAGYLFGNATKVTVTSVSTTTVFPATVTKTLLSTATLMTTGSTTTNAFAISPYGLNFSMSINGTLLNPNQSIEITASIFNALTNANNITANVNNYQFLGYHLFPDPAGYWTGPYLFVVLNGSYTPQSLNGLGGRGWAENGVSAESSTPWSYRFGPSSGSATIATNLCTFACQNTTVGPYRSSASVVVRGYWTIPVKTGSYPSPPKPFIAGVYTAAIGDEWGAVLVLHFTVHGQSTGLAPKVCWIPDQTCSR